ncbi:conserved Plasmodium protein, unknown function [Plasmodium knowlesi strain H]|uniref:Uncharacterized protein n=3 Tax=Plasmodium knowlesi TaxID=5850 RepID=A0A5K1UMH5_PLAKH|nr:conserved Plasmodium protein, unknown function [Plasmodium knowlesi strain H]OTN65466.1 Uncharacterized protein PKNOH_S110102500 [Plasmodium knowlesi]CAA9989644.1 conserved Plasmodium protein, unknown function [Plasmodium knowlesi strain H]SBO22749.1 conserved Plasmodium protein, unknown function [Plasmodium knowlesi strain H]SBO23156.1 conserved Plasmodium protein, unknown function [Plasmodium knowlesi strain H]VVS79118.1 conserved Plasmodium protein, unknown function [Plasmodium knowlesi |eukprot:XP_002260368.1 hypothetical protein, conserved in Plasmodium species [Plasmodium knowlesi strain H]
MSTGWNFQPNGKSVKGKRRQELNYINIFDQGGIPNFRKKNGQFSKGLNCGPAGRKALIRWIEYNYQLKNEDENSYPALSACNVWQRRQSFQDKTLSGLVDFLKFLSIPKHLTYRTVFDNYLFPKFVNRLSSTEASQKGLTKLAKKMMPMFQVREMQPLFSILLDKIDVIPVGILKMLVEETPSAQYFYEITSMNVKRKIWVLCPHKFYQEVEPIIEEIILRIKIKSRHDDTVLALINQIVELIGNEKEKNFLYHLCVHILRLKWVQIILCEREGFTSDCSGIGNGTSPPSRGKESRSDTEDGKLESKTYSTNDSCEKNEFVEDRNLKSEYEGVWENPSYVNLNPVSHPSLDGNHFVDRLKKLHSCFDKIIHKEQNVKGEGTTKFDKTKPYFISLSGYSHYSTSFHYLKKRKLVQAGNREDNIPKVGGTTPWENNENDTEGLLTGTMEPGTEFKNNMKRSWPIGEDAKDAKKIKMNIHNFRKDKICPDDSHVSTSGQMYSEAGDTSTVEKFKEEDGIMPTVGVNKESSGGNNHVITNNNRPSHSSRSSNDKEDADGMDKGKKWQKKEKSANNIKYKSNCNENYPKRTLLPFDGMFYSHLRLLLCLQYKEKYNIKDEDMMTVDPYFPVIEFINHVIREGILIFSDQLKTQEVVKRIKHNLNIKNVEDLCEYSFLFSNILLKFCIIKGICFYFYGNNLEMVPYKNCMIFWTSLFYFGVYNNFFFLIKYALDKMEYKHRGRRCSQYFQLRQRLVGEGIQTCGNFTGDTSQMGYVEGDPWDENREGLSEGGSPRSDELSGELSDELSAELSAELSGESSERVLREEGEEANLSGGDYGECEGSMTSEYSKEVDEDGSSDGSHDADHIEEGEETGSSHVSEGVRGEEQSEELEGTVPSEGVERTAPSEGVEGTAPSEGVEGTAPSEEIDDTVLSEEVDQTENSSPTEGSSPNYPQEDENFREGYNSSAGYEEQFTTNGNEPYDDVGEYQDHLERYDESEVDDAESSEEKKRRNQERAYARYREYEYGEDDDEEEEDEYSDEDEDNAEEEAEEDENNDDEMENDDDEEDDDEDDDDDEEEEEEEDIHGEDEESEKQSENDEYGEDDDESLGGEDEETYIRHYTRYPDGGRKGKVRVRQFKTCSDSTFLAHEEETSEKDDFKLYFHSMRSTQDPKEEQTTNVGHTISEMKSRKKYKVLVKNCKDSYLKIPLMIILKYIVIANNEQGNFLSFFEFIEEDTKFESLKSVKEKNSILLLSALLDIPQVNYLQIKNFFSIIHEFFYMEKKNLPSLPLSNTPPRESNCNAQVLNGIKRVEEHIKSRTTSELLSNNSTLSEYTAKVRNVSSNTYISSNGDSSYGNWGSSKGEAENEIISSRLPLHITNEYTTMYDKDRRVNEWSEDQTSVSDASSINNMPVRGREENTFECLKKRLISQINDMNSAICRNEFLINNNITSICAYLREMGDNHDDGGGGLVNPLSQINVDNATNLGIRAKGSDTNSELSPHPDLIASRIEQNRSTPCSINLFCEISNEIVSKLNNCNHISTINKCLPYILKVCFRTFQFLKKKKLINIYIKYMYLYEYLYHMVLNRMLHISTMKSLPFLQNVILKELHYYFEDLKNRKVKNLWKFYLYAHTLIDINKMNLINKLFHNNAIDYFIKLFYSLSFYNPVFSVLFLKLIQTPLFYRNIENKKSEILQNIWIGTHERNFSENSEDNRQSIEYKIWIEVYNKFITK